MPRDDVPVPAGVLITLDIGARVDGYTADCTRTWATGELPDDLAELHATVLAAHGAGVAAVAAGRTGGEVDAVARDVIAAAGHGERFGHGLGHGVGLEIHEDPRLAQTVEARLEPGQRRHRRARDLRPGPRRGADRGPRRGARGRGRRADLDDAGS